ncbi:MAG: hypothetical protein ACRDFQ_05090 [Anaerolineales bacterium]
MRTRLGHPLIIPAVYTYHSDHIYQFAHEDNVYHPTTRLLNPCSALILAVAVSVIRVFPGEAKSLP